VSLPLQSFSASIILFVNPLSLTDLRNTVTEKFKQLQELNITLMNKKLDVIDAKVNNLETKIYFRMETPQAISKRHGDTSQEYLDYVAKRKTLLDELGKL
jgi:hypothetical protein